MQDFAARLNNLATKCDFEALKTANSIMEVMVKNQLLVGLLNKDVQYKINAFTNLYATE